MLTKQANFEIVSKGGVSFLPTSNLLISSLEKYEKLFSGFLKLLIFF